MSPEFTPPPSDAGQLPSGRIALVAGGWLVLIALAVLAAHLWQVWTRPDEEAGRPPGMGRAEQSVVEQRPFALEDSAARLRTTQHARLEDYGWVDRDAGVIHVPVERAMDAILAEEGARP
ncbi:hypothetical protein LZ198_16530 [Myxococcus sp. K15C18031901]|uniref:hypothetical protein n=1 Tax=Myxococcus dinghuensis TaxID=2906761 RepID=UPI0020A751A6|nr:hypothetical protein [Myxococcus dinghuensis]MCP3100477.1 hypothetical protein [Myxococcus dinghuensis]